MIFLSLKTVIISLKIITVLNLSCNEILEFSEDRQITLTELQETQPKEIIECLAHLSKEKMPMESAEFIWRTLVSYYDGPYNVPEKVMMLLHWVTPALQAEDYNNITLSNINVIENFGFDYSLSQVQLTAIADRVREDFAGKLPEDYTYYDLIALRQILCAFNRTEIEKINPVAYREAAIIIGKLNNCPAEVIQGFATLAVQSKAFGIPSVWSDFTKEAVGIVLDYILKDGGKQALKDESIYSKEKPSSVF